MRILVVIALFAFPCMALAGDSDPIFGGEAAGTFQVAEQTSELPLLNQKLALKFRGKCKYQLCLETDTSAFDNKALARP